MLILHISDALKNATTNSVAQIFGGSLRVDVAEIDSSVQALNTTTHAITHHVDTKPGCTHVSSEWREGGGLAHRGLSDERLGGSGLCLLGSNLLRLGNIRASIFAKVDPLACPCGFSGKCVHDLRRPRGQLGELLNVTKFLTLVATEMLRKWTNPMFLSLTIFTWSMRPNRLSSSRSCSSVMFSSRPPM